MVFVRRIFVRVRVENDIFTKTSTEELFEQIPEIVIDALRADIPKNQIVENIETELDIDRFGPWDQPKKLASIVVLSKIGEHSSKIEVAISEKVSRILGSYTPVSVFLCK